MGLIHHDRPSRWRSPRRPRFWQFPFYLICYLIGLWIDKVPLVYAGTGRSRPQEEARPAIDVSSWLSLADPVMGVIESQDADKVAILDQLLRRPEFLIRIDHMVSASIRAAADEDRRAFDFLANHPKVLVNQSHLGRNILQLAMEKEPLYPVRILFDEVVSSKYDKSMLLLALEAANEADLPVWGSAIELLLSHYFDYFTPGAIHRTIRGVVKDPEAVPVVVEVLTQLFSHREYHQDLVGAVGPSDLDQTVRLGLGEGQPGREIFNVLVERGGADLNAVDENGKTILTRAIDRRDLAGLTELLKEPAVWRYSAETINQAVKYASPEVPDVNDVGVSDKNDFITEILVQSNKVANRLKYNIRWNGFDSDTLNLLRLFYYEYAADPAAQSKEMGYVMDAAVEAKLSDGAVADSVQRLIHSGFSFDLRHQSRLVRHSPGAFQLLLARQFVNLNAVYPPEYGSLMDYAIRDNDLSLLEFLVQDQFRPHYEKKTLERALKVSWRALPIFTETIVKKYPIFPELSVSPHLSRYVSSLESFPSQYWVNPIGTLLDSTNQNDSSEITAHLKELIANHAQVRGVHLYQAAVLTFDSGDNAPFQVLVEEGLGDVNARDPNGSALEQALLAIAENFDPLNLPEQLAEDLPASSEVLLMRRSQKELRNVQVVQLLLKDPLLRKYSQQTFLGALQLSRRSVPLLHMVFKVLAGEPVQVQASDLLKAARLADRFAGAAFFNILLRAASGQESLNAILPLELPLIDLARAESRGVNKTLSQDTWEAVDFMQRHAIQGSDQIGSTLRVALDPTVSQGQVVKVLKFLINSQHVVEESHFKSELRRVNFTKDTTILRVLAEGIRYSENKLSRLLNRRLRENVKKELIERSAQLAQVDPALQMRLIEEKEVSLAAVIFRNTPPMSLLEVAVMERDESLFQTLMQSEAAARYSQLTLEGALARVHPDESDGLIAVVLKLALGQRARIIEPIHLLDAAQLAARTGNRSLLNDLLSMEGADVNQIAPYENFPDGASVLELAVQSAGDFEVLNVLLGGSLRSSYRLDVVKRALDLARDSWGDCYATEVLSELYKDKLRSRTGLQQSASQSESPLGEDFRRENDRTFSRRRLEIAPPGGLLGTGGYSSSPGAPDYRELKSEKAEKKDGEVKAEEKSDDDNDNGNDNDNWKNEEVSPEDFLGRTSWSDVFRERLPAEFELPGKAAERQEEAGPIVADRSESAEAERQFNGSNQVLEDFYGPPEAPGSDRKVHE